MWFFYIFFFLLLCCWAAITGAVGASGYLWVRWLYVRYGYRGDTSWVNTLLVFLMCALSAFLGALHAQVFGCAQ